MTTYMYQLVCRVVMRRKFIDFTLELNISVQENCVRETIHYAWIIEKIRYYR